MWCVLRGNWEYNDQKEVEMIKILMKDEAGLQDNEGKTASHLGCWVQHPGVKLLFEKEKDVLDKNGRNVLQTMKDVIEYWEEAAQHENRPEAPEMLRKAIDFLHQFE